ncbi:MAG: molybdopterin cofactor-binding domain-containing protein, partial [Candidatus Bathyarchaeia archaeon]
ILGWRSDGGTAFSTAYCQVVADEIGGPYENVFHSHFDDHGFVLWQMGGSAGMVSNLIPIIAAARKVKRMILEYATQFLDKFKDKKPEELEIGDGFIFEKANRENSAHISEVARRITIFADADLYDYIEAIANQKPNEVYKRAAFQPRTFELIEPYAKPNMIRQAHFVEVEVDPETGKIDVTNVVVVNDVGRVINPDAVNGQQYGGAYMGLARNHLEAIYYDPLTGVKLNDNLLGYCVPLMNDIGRIDCHIFESGMGYGPYGMAGCSEALGAALSMILGPAVYNAIGKWIDDFPITPEKVLKALGKA